MSLARVLVVQTPLCSLYHRKSPSCVRAKTSARSEAQLTATGVSAMLPPRLVQLDQVAPVSVRVHSAPLEPRANTSRTVALRRTAAAGLPAGPAMFVHPVADGDQTPPS